MKKLVFVALLAVPGLLFALTPKEILEIKEVQPEQMVKCYLPEAPSEVRTCWQFSIEGQNYRAVTELPDMEDAVLRIFTPPSEEYPQGEVKIKEFITKHAQFI